jgi:hypothetical protein
MRKQAVNWTGNTLRYHALVLRVSEREASHTFTPAETDFQLSRPNALRIEATAHATLIFSGFSARMS